MAWLIFQLLYFMLPAYFANMSTILGRVIFKKWNTPVDIGLKIGGKRVFGSHKTFKGFIIGSCIGILTAYLQSVLYPYAQSLSIYNYSNWLALGFLLGFGALAGDSIKSFFKRRVGIKPGERWFPFDQTDFVIGALAFASIVYFPGWENALIILLISLAGHVVVNHSAYYLKIRDEKW